MKNATETNEWICFQNNSLAILGLTCLAQKELGEIVYVELPLVGTKVEKDEILAVVESTKAATDLYSPISGEVVEVNERVQKEPSLLNTSPEEEGWLCKIKISERG